MLDLSQNLRLFVKNIFCKVPNPYYYGPGGLLPHLFTLTFRRYISVALVLRSPSAGVTRYPCPVKPGLSSSAAFRPASAAVRPGRGNIVTQPRPIVKCPCKFFWERIYYQRGYCRDRRPRRSDEKIDLDGQFFRILSAKERFWPIEVQNRFGPSGRLVPTTIYKKYLK